MGAWILRLIILCYGLVAAQENPEQENPDPEYETYENCQVVSVARDLRIYWTVSDDTLNMAMGGNFYEGNPTWMALAWSVGTPQEAIFENQEHPKSLDTLMDVWLVGYDPTESESTSENCLMGFCVVDLTMTLNKATVEKQKDLTIGAVRVSGERLRAGWSRPLNTTDLGDVVITEGEEIVLNWAGVGPYISGSVDETAFSVGKHNLAAVGSARVTFAAGATSTCDEVKSEGNSWAEANGYFSVKWAITATHIEVEMTGKTTGWVGIGWCNTAIMDECDMITGWIADGVVHIYDTYSPNKLRPPFDIERGGVDDVEDAAGEEVDGQTTLRFSRKLVTGDTDNDEDIVNKDFYLQWAIHPEDGVGMDYKEHDRYGIAIVNFITGAASSVSTQDAGWALVFAVWVGFCFYLAVRIAYRAHKRWTKRDFQKTRDHIDKEHVGVKEASGTDNSAGASHENEALFRRQSMMMKRPMRQPQRNALPTVVNRRNMSCGFYQGSTFVGTANWYYQDEFALQIGPVVYEELQRLFQKGAITAETCVWKESLGSDWIPIASQPKFMSSLEAGPGPGPIEMVSISETSSTVTEIVTEVVPASELGGGAAEEEGVRAKPVNSKKLAQRAWLNRRVPYFHLPVSGLLTAFIYLGLNLACLSIGVHTLSVKTGYLAAANSFLLAVPATRNSVLTWLFAASFDQVIVLHRMLGQWTVFLVTLHMFWSWNDWAPTNDFAAIMEKQFTEDKYLYGWLSWFAGAFIFVSSLGYFRRKHFEWFYYLHFSFAFFYAFAYMHSDAMRPYLIATLMVYLTDRAIRIFWGLNPQRAQLALVRDDVITIRFAKHPVASCLDMYDVGQYVFINVPSISLLEWHPFSLSSGPREKTLEVTIRGLGDHTNRLVALASKSTSTTWIRVDGPYGNQKANLRRFPVMILIGGGVGVTPLIGLMKDIFNIGDTEKPPRPSAMQHVYLSWSTRNESTYLAFVDHINQVKAASDDPSLPSFTPILHITSSHNQPGVRSGRPVLPTLFEQVATECPNQAATVFACGPTALVNQAWDTAQRRQKSGQRFDFHHETFEF